jgi:hypothetical protein
MKPNIKWVTNSRVKKNRKIPQDNVVEESYRAKRNEIVVTMINSSKKRPIINIEFPSETENGERTEKNSAGKWITKSWTTKHNITASINTEENYIHFNRTRFKPSELNEVTKAIKEVNEIIFDKMEKSPLW